LCRKYISPGITYIHKFYSTCRHTAFLNNNNNEFVPINNNDIEYTICYSNK